MDGEGEARQPDARKAGKMTATRRPVGAARLAKTYMRTGHLHHAVSRPRCNYDSLERQSHSREACLAAIMRWLVCVVLRKQFRWAHRYNVAVMFFIYDSLNGGNKCPARRPFFQIVPHQQGAATAPGNSMVSAKADVVGQSLRVV
jgi:hypothetical protein